MSGAWMHWRDLLIKNVDPFAADADFLRHFVIVPYEFHIDLSSRPFTVDLSASWPRAALGLIATSLAVALLIHHVVTTGSSDTLVSLIVILLILALLTLVVRPCLSALLLRRRATFTPYGIHVTEPDGTDWQCDYRDFLGVRRRQVTIFIRSWAHIYQIIDLIHHDSFKTITLCAIRADTPQTGLLRRYADMLGVPIAGEYPDED